MRILALILAVLMVVGVAYILIAMLAPAMTVSAAETGVIDTSSLKEGGDVLVSVGLLYGDDVEVEFGVRTDNGFTVGVQELSGGKTFTEIWEFKENAISCMSDANIAKNASGGLYSIASKPENAYIGGYHIQIDCDDLDRAGFTEFLGTVRTAMANFGLNVCPAYIYTGYAVRIGAFPTWQDAEHYLDAAVELFPGKTVTVVAPASTAVSVIDTNTEKIIFEYDCGLNSVIGLKAAKKDQNGNTYMKTPAGNVYDGVFAFKRFVDNLNDGVSLINILPLEAYVAGVLPYEISNAWPIESQKEFAVTVRSFTLTNLNSKHKFYEFDLCNTTCCEVYKGAGRINSAVMSAVEGTRGMVSTYNGDIIPSYYSSTVGGVTVSSADCWGGAEIPYLQAIETPWEDYMNHANGFWTFEVSPAELAARLNRAGFSSLKDEIADVKIVELAKNSTYVKKLQVTDVYGTSVTITNTDKVRTSLTPYVNSANFVVGKGSVEYTETTVLGGDAETTVDEGIDAEKYEGFFDISGATVITAKKSEKVNYKGAVKVLTADGQLDYTKKGLFAITKDTAKYYDGTQNTAPKEEEKKPETETKVEYKTAHASDPNNFIFVGKGWGHGVGMSQWGCYDLAVKGYTYDQIIAAYFPTVKLTDYHNTNNYKNKIAK